MNALTAIRDTVADNSTTGGELAVIQPPRGNVVPLSPGPKLYPPKIAKALMAMTREFGAIEKRGKNTFHNYSYQMWEDVLQRESELISTHGLIIQQSEVARTILEKLISITYEFSIINEDGDVWPDRPVWTAIARMIDHKGVFDDKAANKCHTQAHKYFLLHLFKIKTHESVEDDSDAGDKVTGNAERHVETRPSSPETAQRWAAEFTAAVAKAEDLNPLIEASRKHLDKLKLTHRAIYDTLVKAVQDRRKALAEPAKPAAKPAMPSPENDPARFIDWLVAELAPLDANNFEDVWNDRLAGLVDRLDPVHYEDAMGHYRRHTERLEP